MEEKDTIENIDILNRKAFIENVLTIISSCKQQKYGTSFSVSGGWGIGKSFVLDSLQEKLSTDYVVLRYDSWKYDYYEEPLVALVSNIADQLLDDGGKVSSGIAVTAAKAAMRMGWECAVGAAGPFGFILKAAEKSYGEFQKDEMKALDYDHYSSLKKNLIAIQKLIETLSKEKPVILMIDELDRCLPTYQIKVLERIHHMIEDTQIIVIYALNPVQLSETIRQIYGGNDERVTAYLKKFLHFSLSLDVGKVSDEVRKKYESDLCLFEPCNTEGSAEKENWFDKVCRQLLSELDIRTQEKLWEKRRIIHNIVFQENAKKLPQIFLTCELFLLVMNEWKKRVCIPSEWTTINWTEDIPIATLVGGGFKPEYAGKKVDKFPSEGQAFWNDLHQKGSRELKRFISNKNVGSRICVIDSSNVDDAVYLIAVWTSVNNTSLQIEKSDAGEKVFAKLRNTMKEFNIFVKMMT
jgi:hypothetical protein